MSQRLGSIFDLLILVLLVALAVQFCIDDEFGIAALCLVAAVNRARIMTLEESV